jgi:hypothetical protein
MIHKYDKQRNDNLINCVAEWLARYVNSVIEDELPFTQSTFGEDAEALLEAIKHVDIDKPGEVLK